MCENNPSFKLFKNFIKDKEVELDDITSDIEKAMMDIIKAKKEIFAGFVGKLDALSPLKVLERGYAVAFDDDGKVIRKCTDTSSGDEISVRLSDGDIACVVK